MPEKYIFDQPIEQHPQKHEEGINVVAAFEKAEEVLSNPIDPTEFTNYAGVEADIAEVTRLEKIFKTEFDESEQGEQHLFRMGKIFEAIMFEHIELSNWLGENAMTVQASHYDDYKNGVDSYVEFDEGPQQASYIACAFDITTSDHIARKFDRIKSEIDAGELPRIKYFVSEKLNIKGEKNKIPRVIVGADRQTVYELARLWMNGENRKLGAHPIQFKILEEMMTQLDCFRTYADKIGRNDIAEIYGHGYQIIADILTEKNPSPEILAHNREDHVFEEIIAHARSLANA